ncbi:MAG: GYD domain-containing protein [Pirellulales bacterium]
MATYILLGTFTDQGIRNIKDTTKRAEAVRAMGKKLGVTVKDLYWTLGQYDVAAILDAPDEAAATSLALSIGALGNVRTQLLRAFTEKEIGSILGRMAKPARGQK